MKRSYQSVISFLTHNHKELQLGLYVNIFDVILSLTMNQGTTFKLF